ncbi:MAG: hypothetical protein KY452_13040 [Actinobacteria bacterium]|nr:hypothetical protein [Actinomycetota bacterium]
MPSCEISRAAPPDVDCTGGEDPGAFQLSAGGTGAAGSACAGRTFTITEIDAASGKHRFIPDQDVVLGAAGTATDTCVINFTFDVARLPARDAFPDESGIQTTQVAFSAATFSPSMLTGSGTGTDLTTVAEVAGSVVSPPTTVVSVVAGSGAVRPPGACSPAPVPPCAPL